MRLALSLIALGFFLLTGRDYPTGVQIFSGVSHQLKLFEG